MVFIFLEKLKIPKFREIHHGHTLAWQTMRKGISRKSKESRNLLRWFHNKTFENQLLFFQNNGNKFHQRKTYRFLQADKQQIF